MLGIPSAAILGMLFLFLPVGSTRAERVGQTDAVVQLLNLFASRTDPLATANAGKLLNKGISPAEVVATNLHEPLSVLGGWNSPQTTRSLSFMLGDYVVSHSEQFPDGLPEIDAVMTPIRLGPFFEGLFPPLPRTSYLLEKDLANLQRLLDSSWLEAAASCGAIRLHQLLLTHRGQLNELLLSYQETENDIALICLGEAIANYSRAIRQIEPSGLSTRTLAHLLAGAMGIDNTDPEEKLTMIEIAAGWAVGHPELIVMLRALRDPSSLSLFEAHLLWQTGDREAAMRLLVSDSETGPWMKAGVIMRVLPKVSMSDDEAANLIRLLPGEVLVACVKRSGPVNTSNVNKRLAGWFASELRSRGDHREYPK